MFQTRCWATAAAAVVVIGLPGVSAAATLNVPGDFATIQACINAAVSGVDECVVAPGTYHETINFLGKAITVHSSGGADVTTIDATGIGGSVVTCASGEGPDSLLDGFIITGGTGTELGGGQGRGGGGMYNEESSPTIANCTFSGHTGNYGGGMYNRNGTPTITNCTFKGNTVGFLGGAMCNVGSSATVTDCAFDGNTSGDLGGAIYNGGGSPTVTGCTFNGNMATYDGGGMYNGGSPTVSHCIFIGNTGGYNGGGMYNSSGTPIVTDCTFRRNKSRYGGGMKNDSGSNATVTTCVFIENMVTREGGGMYNNVYSSPKMNYCAFNGNTAVLNGGGVFNHQSNLTVINCSFCRNTAGFGGGMYNEYSNLTATHCTFSENVAQYFLYSAGGAVYNADSSQAALANSILWADSPNEIVYGPTSAAIITHSDIHDGLPFGAVDGGGNINLDPMFVRPPDSGPDGMWDGVDDDYGDLRLRPGSPCINAGDPGFVAQPGETDLEGHARVLCGRVDMGAYEFGIGDYDCDQSVDLMDFNAWNACMTAPHDVRELALAALTGPAVQSAIDTCPEPRRNRQLAIGCEAFDFDADGDVDLVDFAAFQGVLTAP